VAAVPVHEEMRISLERPEEKDLMFEDGGGGGIEEKTHFGPVNADFDDR